jgi:hypothetical protein
MRPTLPLAAVLASLVLAGCGGSLPAISPRASYEPEAFDSTTTHARSFAANEAQTCEAARRALLSQGYLINAATSEQVTGRKSFQPAGEVHVEVEFRVVCAREGKRMGGGTVAFATALQDRYSLKKVNNSASVGVGAIGSVSLPFSSSDDAMVKVASETLTEQRFYDRFFALIDRYLVLDTPADTPAHEAPPARASAETPALAPSKASPKAQEAPAAETAPVPVPVSASRG